MMTTFEPIRAHDEELRPLSPTGTEDEPPTPSHLRRWSSPGEYGSLPHFPVEPLAGNCDCDDGVNIDGIFKHLAERRYSFYLGPELSPWGPSAAPLRAEAVERRRERSGTRKEDLPPYLTTLSRNGRPRFRLMNVRVEGRLEIARVAVEEPELVSVRGREGLRIGTVRISRDEPDDKTQHS